LISTWGKKPLGFYDTFYKCDMSFCISNIVSAILYDQTEFSSYGACTRTQLALQKQNQRATFWKSDTQDQICSSSKLVQPYS